MGKPLAADFQGIRIFSRVNFVSIPDQPSNDVQAERCVAEAASWRRRARCGVLLVSVIVPSQRHPSSPGRPPQDAGYDQAQLSQCISAACSAALLWLLAKSGADQTRRCHKEAQALNECVSHRTPVERTGTRQHVRPHYGCDAPAPGVNHSKGPLQHAGTDTGDKSTAGEEAGKGALPAQVAARKVRRGAVEVKSLHLAVCALGGAGRHRRRLRLFCPAWGSCRCKGSRGDVNENPEACPRRAWRCN